MTHFHLMRTQKHKILSIIVLNMAKYTIISLILIDFVPIFVIFNLLQRICRGSFCFKGGGGSNHFNIVPSSKKSQPRSGGGRGVISTLDQFPTFPGLFYWKASLNYISGRLATRETINYTV